MDFKFDYICPYCNEQITIDLSDFEEITESKERQMGTELCHTINFEGECPLCNNAICISGDVWEYPEGVLNLNDTKIV